MRPLTRPAATIVTTLAALAAALMMSTAPASAASGSSSGCTGFSAGRSWVVSCQGGGHPPGGGGGAGGHQVCTWTANVDQYWPGATRFLPPPGPHQVYLVEVCGTTFGTPQLVTNGGHLTPAGLARQVWDSLSPPPPAPVTAPPQGSDGLVGLPEWFWVPAGQWQPVTSPVARVGGVWAQVTATPSRLVFGPGAGMGAVSCAGPGSAYDPALAPSAQHTSCSYTYSQSSDGLPGNAYQATVSITWTATWRGSGGTHGTLPALTSTTRMALPVAEAQALNPPGGQP